MLLRRQDDRLKRLASPRRIPPRVGRERQRAAQAKRAPPGLALGVEELEERVEESRPEDLAQLLGASRQRVNQELKAFERDGAVRIEPTRLVVLSRPKLLAIADRLFVINFGQKLAEGAPRAVMGDPEVRRVYMGMEA